MHFRSVGELTNISGKNVLVRVDFNVPIKNGGIVDDFRIKKALPTIKHLLSLGAHLILVGHLDDKEGPSLKPVADYLNKIFPLEFIPSVDPLPLPLIKQKAKENKIVFLEDIRNNPLEEKNDEDFAKELASLADYYVNEAFSVSHRKHASIVGVPKFIPGYLGFVFEREIKELSRAFNPQHPFLFILGGAKFETKQPLVEKFLELADTVFVGGALGNDFFKAKGYSTGASLVSGELPEEKIFENKKIMTPVDVVVKDIKEKRLTKKPTEIKDGEVISDAGPETLLALKEKIMEAKLILWNGPLGYYEFGFDEGTKEVAKMLADTKARSIVGGGDTTAAIEELGIIDKLSFVSTGGGAMLDFLAKGTLPGIEALEKSK